ncbi:MAG: hypothetical protein ABUT20_08835 [Bacteroidota bacterium]
MKKILITLFVFTAIAVNAKSIDRNPEINQKIIKSFNQTFIYAQDVVWQQKDDVYQANFWQGGINIRAKYDEQGNLLGTIRYYFEKQLPPAILSSVKKKYAGKSIFGVTEVSSDEDISYFVTMQDDKNWYTIKSDAFGNLQQTEKFKKADGE